MMNYHFVGNRRHGDKKTLRPPLVHSKKSRIFTRASADFNKGGLAVKFLRERE